MEVSSVWCPGERRKNNRMCVSTFVTCVPCRRTWKICSPWSVLPASYFLGPYSAAIHDSTVALDLGKKPCIVAREFIHAESVLSGSWAIFSNSPYCSVNVTFTEATWAFFGNVKIICSCMGWRLILSRHLIFHLQVVRYTVVLKWQQ